jgi:hypothetical protein
MIRRLMMLGLCLAILTLGVGCEKTDDVTGTGGGTNGTSNVPDSLALARTFPPLLADGVAEVDVEATVVDGLGRGLPGIGVAFATDHGSITQFATTDADGRARATLTSQASMADVVASVTAAASTTVSATGQAQIGALVLTHSPLSKNQRERVALAGVGTGVRLNATTGNATTGNVTTGNGTIHDTAQVPMTGVTLALVATPATIPADGITSSRVVATLIETTRRIPLDGREIRFGSTEGSITGHVVTDAEGAAAASLTGAPGEIGAGVTAYFGHTLTAQTSVTFSPLSLELTVDSPTILADGVSETEVVARLVNQAGNPVVGAQIDFTTTAGTIGSPVMTDDRGHAVARLVAPATPGTGEVRARFGGVLSRTASVTFASMPATARVLLRVDAEHLPADGASEAVVTATALDAQSNPMPDGTVVTFSVTAGDGRIVGPARVTEGGVAEALFVAGTAAGAVTIQAASGSATATTALTLQPLEAGNIVLSTDHTGILADGEASALITAVVTDRFGHSVRQGTALQFVTSNGVLSEMRPTDETGTASVRLRSIPRHTGIARVTVSAGTTTRTIDVKFVSEAAAHIEAVSVAPRNIGVRGASDHETATITFEVQDRNGIPVDADHPVTLGFTLTGDGGASDATVYPTTATTDGRGLVQTSVNAGEVAGTVRVDAVSGGITSLPIRVAIHGDLPDPAHFSVFPEKLNVAGRVYAGIQYHVTAKVGDQHGNPVPDSTSVWFRTTHGVIQGSAVTGPVADATVIAETAGPFPNIDGFVTHTAQTISKAGNWIETSTLVLWSGHAQLAITSPESGFTISNGGLVVIDFTVCDDLGNPLVGGTSIKVSATAGTLGGDTDFVLPDTQSRAYTHFSVVLSDDDIETNMPAAVTVTVKISSQNGNVGAYVTGTKY